MHFSIPDSQEVSTNGLNYISYNLHVNGVFHCNVRYRQLHTLHEQIKRDYANISLPKFPGKKLLPLTLSQLDERRAQLEKYIQAVGQNEILVSSELFNTFLLNTQQLTSGVSTKLTTLDVFLMNGFKISLDIKTNERTDSILAKALEQLNVPQDYGKYFCLYLIRTENNVIQRRLQDFESPYISLETQPETHKIFIRKNCDSEGKLKKKLLELFFYGFEVQPPKSLISYWDSNLDLILMSNKVALNILYAQTVNDVEKGWILCSNDTLRNLAKLQSQGAKKQYMELARTLKFYGYLQFAPCICDYPYEGSKVIVSAGNKELNLRIRLSDEDDIRQGSFKVTRMRCWRITTLHPDENNRGVTNLELSFEYLMARDKLQWITIQSEQAVLMSMCLQTMVAELLLNNAARQESLPAASYSSASSSSSSASSSAATSDCTVTTPCSDLTQNSQPSSFDRPSGSGGKSRKKVFDKYTVSFNPSKSTVNNECFDNDGIGDDDL